jgi:hypothetical protein
MSVAFEGGDDPRVGTTVSGRYFIHRRLGRGGMGDVYDATRLEDDRPVALKLLRATADGERLRRFEREAAAAARLRHPNCVEVLDSGPDGQGGFFIAMELVRGPDLARVLHEDGPLQAVRAGRVADQILSVLADAHAAGVIHRDLKPANVMIDSTREGPDFVKVLDFGIATFIEPADGDARLTRDGVAQGTPAYMSPEQIRGEPLDARSDLYAVGALLFELLAGAPPFEAPSPMAVVARQLTERAPPLGKRAIVPPALAALVARALEQDRAHRPASAVAMREELHAALDGVCAPGKGPPRALPPTEAFAVADLAPARVRRGRAVVAGAVLVAGAIAAVLFLGGSGATSTRRSAVPSAVPATATSTGATESATVGAVVPASVLPPQSKPPARLGAKPPAHAAPTRAASVSPPIRLVRGELNAVPTPPAATGDGVLVLQASPWAAVSIAGEALGESPREVRIRAGTYGVRAAHPELGVREDRVEVRAGERTLWTATFKE